MLTSKNLTLVERKLFIVCDLYTVIILVIYAFYGVYTNHTVNFPPYNL